MRWITVYCIFLAGITVSISASDDRRPKRSLNHILNFVSSKLFGSNNNYYTNALKVSSAKPVLVSENEKYKILRLPGFNKVLVKAVPKVTVTVGHETNADSEKEAPKSALGGKAPALNANQIEPLIHGPYLEINSPAIQDVENLLDSGMLNASHDVPYIQYIITTNTHNVHVDGSINVGSQPTPAIVDVIKPIQIPQELLPLPLPSQPQLLPVPDIIEIQNVVPNVPQPVIIEEIHQIEPKPTIIDLPVPSILSPVYDEPLSVTEEINKDDGKPIVIDYGEVPVLPTITNSLEPEIFEEIYESQPIIFDIPPPPILPPLTLQPMSDMTKPVVEDDKHHDNEQSVNINMPSLPVLPALPPLPTIDTPIGIYNPLPHVVPLKPAAKPTIINIPSPPVLSPWPPKNLERFFEYSNDSVIGNISKMSHIIEQNNKNNLKHILANITATSRKPSIPESLGPLDLEEIDVKPLIFDIPPPSSLVQVLHNPNSYKYGLIHNDGTVTTYLESGIDESLINNRYQSIKLPKSHVNKIEALPANTMAAEEITLQPLYSLQNPEYFGATYQENVKPLITEFPLTSVLRPNVMESVYVKKQPIIPTVIDIPKPPILSAKPNLPKPIVVEEIHQGNVKPMVEEVLAPPIAMMKAPFAIGGLQYLHNPNLYKYGLIHNDGTVTTYLESGIDESLINNRYQSIKLPKSHVNKIEALPANIMAAEEMTLQPLYSLQNPEYFGATYQENVKPLITEFPLTSVLRPNVMESVYVEKQPIIPTVIDIPKPPILSAKPNLPKPIVVEEIHQGNVKPMVEEVLAPPISIMKAPFAISGTQYLHNPNLYRYGLIHNDGTITTYQESGIDESLIDNRLALAANTVAAEQMTLPQKPEYFEATYQENVEPIIAEIPIKPVLHPNIMDPMYVEKQQIMEPTVMNIPEPPVLSPISNFPKPVVVEEIYEDNIEPIAAEVLAPPIDIMKAPFAVSRTQYLHNPNLYRYGLIHNDGTITTYQESGIDESLIDNRLALAANTVAAEQMTLPQKPEYFEATYQENVEPIIAEIPIKPVLHPNIMDPMYVEKQQIMEPTVMNIPEPPVLSPISNFPKPVVVEEIYEDNIKPIAAEVLAPPIDIMKAPFAVSRTQYLHNPNLYRYGLINNDGTITTYQESGIDESLIDNRLALAANTVAAEQMTLPQKPEYFEATYQENVEPIIAEIPIKPVLHPNIMEPMYVEKQQNMKPTVMNIPEPPVLSPISNLPKPVVVEEIYEDDIKPIAVEVLAQPINITKAPFAVSRTQYLHNPNSYNYGLIHNDGSVTTFQESGIDESMIDNNYKIIKSPQEEIKIPQMYSNGIHSGLVYKSTRDKTTSLHGINSMNSPKYSYRLVDTNGTLTKFKESGINKAQELESHGLKLMTKGTVRVPPMQNQKGNVITTVINAPTYDYSQVRNQAHLISPYEVESAVISNPYSYGLIHNDGTKTTFLESGTTENRDKTIKPLATKNIKLLPQHIAADIAVHAEKSKITPGNYHNNFDNVVTKKYASNPYTYQIIQNDGSMIDYVDSGENDRNILKPISLNAEILQNPSGRLYNINNDASYTKNADFLFQPPRMQTESRPYSYGLVHNDGTVTNYVESGINEKIVDNKMRNILPGPPSYIMNRLEEVVAIAENCHDLNNKADDISKEDDVQIVVQPEPVVSTYVYKQMNHNNPSPYTVVNLNGQSNTVENIDINILKTNKGNNRGDIPDTVL